jgi:glycosyltransferase involved in cell wall biosynthesis
MCKASRVPPERSATADPGRLSVALDATPLLGRPTGVGAFVAGALGGLGARPDIDVSAFAISWRRRQAVPELVPPGVATRQRAMPARPLHITWSKVSTPPLEWFVGPQQVIHGTNYVVPPTRRAARVVTVHDLTITRFPELCDTATLRFPALIRRAVAEGAWVHTPSAFVAAEVVETFDIPAERVRAVHLGVPPQLELAGDVASLPLPFELPAGTSRYLLAVGTVEPRKDYPALVRAFTAIATAHPDVALVLVGPDGWGAASLQEAIDRSSARTRIVRPGYLTAEEVVLTLRRAAAVAYPSVYEGFGFPPLQAMAAGVPVVATDVGAIPEISGDGARLVPGGDEDALAQALSDLLDGGPEVEALIARGHRRTASYSWAACAEGLADLYRAARDDHGGPGRRGGRG